MRRIVNLAALAVTLALAVVLAAAVLLAVGWALASFLQAVGW